MPSPCPRRRERQLGPFPTTLSVLPGDLLERPPHGLQDEEGEEEARHVGDGEDDEGLLPDVFHVAPERAALHLEGCNDVAGLPDAALMTWQVELGRQHEGGADGVEVGEEGKRVRVEEGE